ncbi:MAG TPA: DUF2158 domain-containing protein [Candidatus Binataceae bacterium]|nr:DUF2158 domain-containing protein [Candidatus Binataceae bacterium]
MADEMKVGDIVQLKSGGPDMTIEHIDTWGSDHVSAKCVWFDGSKRKAEVFALAILKKAE